MKNTRIRRTRIKVGRTSPSTRLGATIERPADVPLGDGDSDRDVAQPRTGCLSSRSTDDSVDSSPMQADGPSSGLFPRTDRQSPLLLLTTATSLSADVPWLPVSSRRTDAPLLRFPQTLQLLPTTATSTSADVPRLPVSSGGPTQHPAFTWQQR